MWIELLNYSSKGGSEVRIDSLNLVGICFFLSILVSSCSAKSSSSSGFSFGAPEISPIVDSATPTGLKGSSASLTKSDFARLLDTADTEASFKAFATSSVFSKNMTGSVAAPVFYRYWVDVLDESMAQIDQRLAGMEENSEDACWNQDAVELTHTFTVGTEVVSVIGKYNCWENQGSPNADKGGFQKMAFGKDENFAYLMYITVDSTTFAASEGERIIFGKVDLDGNNAEIWFIGRSLQGMTNNQQIRGVANRIIANKTTGAFSFALSDEGIGSTNCAMYANSDGSLINFQARTPEQGSSTQCKNVTGMEWGVGACYDATTLESATGCESLAGVTDDFGLSTTFKETDVAAVKAGSETIAGFDFAAAGVAELK